jgi:hypothetical protein
MKLRPPVLLIAFMVVIVCGLKGHELQRKDRRSANFRQKKNLERKIEENF